MMQLMDLMNNESVKGKTSDESKRRKAIEDAKKLQVDPLATKEAPWATDFLKLPHMWLFGLALASYADHFMKRPILSNKWLESNLQGVSGGVSNPHPAHSRTYTEHERW